MSWLVYFSVEEETATEDDELLFSGLSDVHKPHKEVVKWMGTLGYRPPSKTKTNVIITRAPVGANKYVKNNRFVLYCKIWIYMQITYIVAAEICKKYFKKLAKLRRHASRVHFAKIHFG